MNLPKARTVLAIISVIGYIFVTFGFFFVLFKGSSIKLPEGDIGKAIIGMLGMVVGTWGTIMGFVYTFHYGTSQSSADKNNLVEKALEQKKE